MKTKNYLADIEVYQIVIVFIVILFIFGVIGCSASSCTESVQQSYEISKQADNFKTPRKLMIVNTRTDKIILEFTGTFSIQHSDDDIDILCALGDDRYEKHFFQLNEWTIYIVEDVSNQDVPLYFKEIKYYPENA